MDNSKKDFEAKAMMVVYSDGEDYYLETHEIYNNKVQQGKPMSLKGIQKLTNVFQKTQKVKLPAVKGKIPKNLLYIDSNPTSPIIIWHRPPQDRKIYFRTSEKKTRSGVVELPWLVFALKDETLSIVCIKEEPVDNKIPTFHAPFPNTYQGNNVCMGNVKIKYDTEDISEIIAAIESYFFNSRFNEMHHSMCKVDVKEMWKKMMEFKIPFDNEVLIETEKTLEDFINGREN